MSRHPHWYFEYYDQIFAKYRDYEKEIKKIDKCCSLKNKRVQEIGGGKGHHSFLILEKKVKKLDVIDNDPSAVKIIKDRISKEKVNVYCKDGFGKCQMKYDIVICMFSLVQQCNNENIFITRLNNLLSRVRTGGTIVFEFIDSSISREIYKHGNPTKVHTDELSYSITSFYDEKVFQIVYEFDKPNFKDYRVRLLNLSISKILNIAQSLKCIRVEIKKLDPQKRRNLAFIQK